MVIVGKAFLIEKSNSTFNTAQLGGEVGVQRVAKTKP